MSLLSNWNKLRQQRSSFDEERKRVSQQGTVVDVKGKGFRKMTFLSEYWQTGERK